MLVTRINVVSSGGLAFKHLALGAKGHRFDPSKRSKLFSQDRGWMTTLNGAAVSTELIKIRGGGVKSHLRT